MPGKFEGCPSFVEHFWNLALEGMAEDDGEVFTFHLDAEDRAAWPDLGTADELNIWEDSNGFVSYDFGQGHDPFKSQIE